MEGNCCSPSFGCWFNLVRKSGWWFCTMTDTQCLLKIVAIDFSTNPPDWMRFISKAIKTCFHLVCYLISWQEPSPPKKSVFSRVSSFLTVLLYKYICIRVLFTGPAKLVRHFRLDQMFDCYCVLYFVEEWERLWLDNLSRLLRSMDCQWSQKLVPCNSTGNGYSLKMECCDKIIGWLCRRAGRGKRPAGETFRIFHIVSFDQLIIDRLGCTCLYISLATTLFSVGIKKSRLHCGLGIRFFSSSRCDPKANECGNTGREKTGSGPESNLSSQPFTTTEEMIGRRWNFLPTLFTP